MNIPERTARTIAFVVEAPLLLIAGAEAAGAQTMNGGMMNGPGMGVYGWGWLPVVLLIVIVVALVSFLIGRK